MVQSEIKIDKEGIWYYRGAHMFRKEFLCIFFENIKIDEKGKYLIELGDERCYLDVEDTVFVVNAVYKGKHPDGRLECLYIFLTDDTMEILDLKSLRIGENNVPYCRIKKGKFKARFSRRSYYQLAEFIEQSFNEKEYFIMMNGEKYPVKKKY
ncbi:MAG TPA: DUF1285 domain-containing protein [Deltaproteobacteria bacterium]|nr:DUF1285 domain-containing protein [Deltaproteobacteria bacterium]